MSKFDATPVIAAIEILNGSGLLESPIVTEGLPEEDQVRLFASTVFNIPSTVTLPAEVDAAYSAIPDELMPVEMPENSGAESEGTATESTAPSTEAKVGDCATFGQYSGKDKECKKCATDTAEMHTRCKDATAATKAGAKDKAKADKAAAKAAAKDPNAPKKAPPVMPKNVLGHRIGSIGDMIDKYIIEGTAGEDAILVDIMKSHNKDERLAKNKFAAHISHLRKVECRTIEVTKVEGKADVYKLTSEAKPA